MKRFLLIAMLLLINSILTLYAQEWVSVGDATGTRQSPSIEILRSDDKQYKIRVTIYGYEKNTITENNTAYSQIDIPDWQQWGKVGEPALPVLTQFIGIPANHEYTISVSDTIWETHSIGKIYPRQELREESDTSIAKFVINDSIYSNRIYITERYFSSEKICVGGLYGVSLSILPFKYYPMSNKISVLKSCIVTVEFSPSSVVSGNLLKTNDMLLKNVIDNYNESLINTYKVPESDSININLYDYLIITTDQYKNTDILKEFCIWKRVKGHNCKVVSYSEFGRNNTKTIKNYINDWYNKGVKYVLFVGNHDDIPCKPWNYDKGTRKYKCSDYWYVCLTSDYIADLGIGRFCINNITELSNIISKTINYENFTSKDTWINKNLLIAHKEDALEKYQVCCEEIRTADYKNTPHFTTAYGAHDSLGGNNATNEMVVSYINEGFGVVNYRGHGDIDSWDEDWSNEGESFDISNVVNINTQYHPLVFSIACSTGDITRLRNKNCLLHDFTKSKYGAVAFLGSTNFINTDAASTLNKHLYTMLYNNSVYEFAYLNNMAQIKNILTFPYDEDSKSYAISNAISFICGGDPSLEIWTDTISKFSDVNITYQNGDININTNSIENYTVTLFSPVDSNYFERFDVEGTSFTKHSVPQNFIISLNKHNYMPLVYYVSNGDVYIQNENYALVRNIIGNDVYVGSDVTDAKPKGSVTIKSDAKLHIKSSGKTIIKKGVVVEQGANLYINK